MTDDLRRIEELHQADVAASLGRDYRTLRGLLSDDAVMLPPGGAMIRGREALDRSFAAMRDAAAATEVVEYRFDWREVQVCGDYAFEWGYAYGAERDRRSGRTTSETYQLMRILQRQADGTWKVHRSIWNEPAK